MLDEQLTIQDLKYLNGTLVSSLEKFLKVCKEKKDIEAQKNMSTEEQKDLIGKLTLDGIPIDDLYLDFTLPGYPEWELIPDGKVKGVTIWNLEEYLTLIVSVFLEDGVKGQLESFKKGFDEVFALESLRGVFSVFELEIMLCGMNTTQKWSLEELQKHTRCDHGYAVTSRSVRNLWEILSEFAPEEQRQFLLFVTGSPKLPVGGWKSLRPKLTIVRKDQERGSSSPDNYLPSVMTCVNYLKLPDYSSKAVLKEKLLMAMKEGSGEFHLS